MQPSPVRQSRAWLHDGAGPNGLAAQRVAGNLRLTSARRWKTDISIAKQRLMNSLIVIPG